MPKIAFGKYRIFKIYARPLKPQNRDIVDQSCCGLAFECDLYFRNNLYKNEKLSTRIFKAIFLMETLKAKFSTKVFCFVDANHSIVGIFCTTKIKSKSIHLFFVQTLYYSLKNK
jgi:hypothetical protein